MITIDQLLESVDLDFEPRFVTKDLDGEVNIWEVKPVYHDDYYGLDDDNYGEMASFGKIKFAEFENKHWLDCIYEVPQKIKGKIERFTDEDCGYVSNAYNNTVEKVIGASCLDKLNAIVDAVNELKGAKNE